MPGSVVVVRSTAGPTAAPRFRRPDSTRVQDPSVSMEAEGWSLREGWVGGVFLRETEDSESYVGPDTTPTRDDDAGAVAEGAALVFFLDRKAHV